MGREFVEIRITHPRDFIHPEPEAVRPRLLDWQIDAKGGCRLALPNNPLRAGRPTEVVVGRDRPAPVDQRRRRVPEGRGGAPRRSTLAQTAVASQEHVQRPGAAAVARWSRVVHMRTALRDYNFRR